MSLNKKISSNPDLSGTFRTLNVEDGNIFIPIPLILIQRAGLDFNLPVVVAPLDIGGIYVYNKFVHNPDLVKALIPKIKL